MKYKVFLNSPGIVVTLLHNDKTIRTPYEFIIDESDKGLIESMIRMSSISDFKILKTTESEVIKTTNKQKLSIQRPQTNINIGMVIGGVNNKGTV